MNTTDVERLRSVLNDLLDEFTPKDLAPAPEPDPLPEGVTTLAELAKVEDNQLSPEGWLDELTGGPEGWIEDYAKHVGRHNAKMEYLHDLALAEMGVAAFYTRQYAEEEFPDHTRVHTRLVPFMLEVLAKSWTDALTAWKAYEDERRSVYSVEESAA